MQMSDSVMRALFHSINILHSMEKNALQQAVCLTGASSGCHGDHCHKPPTHVT
jgi:hypothetical protein